MKKLLLIISGLIFSVNTVNAQLGVGAPLPSTSSQLDVVSTNKGILIPRVSLTGSTDATTISNGNVNSLLVFNTQTIADITPGYYYWYTNKWNALGAGGSSTLTSESFDPVTGILSYNDENGTTTSLNLSTMVPNFETLTSAAFVPATGVLTYNDEKGLPTVMNLSTMVPNFETLTSAAFVPATGILTYNDEKGIATNMDLSGLSSNNWLVDLTTDKATLNTQNIYQMGNVGIGTNTIIPNVALDVRGALRSGASHGGVVGVNSAAFGTSTSAPGLNAAAFGATSAAAGPSSIAGGTFSSVDAGASNTISFGFTTVAYGSDSAAFGVLNQTRGNRSFVNGSSNIATSFGETVVGYSNAIRTIGNVTTVTLTDPVFQVGNGNDVGSVFSNALTILKNGNTGIGIAGVEAAAKPTERLDIGSGNLKVRDINTNVGLATDNIVVADATGIFKTVAASSLAGNNWQAIGNTGTTAGTNFIGTTDAQDFVVKTNNNEVARVTQTGNVGIGTATPNNKLEITAATPNTSGLTFTNLNSASPGDATVLTPLGVNATGTVVAMLPDTRYAVRQVSASYTAILTDETILVDNTAASVIITLPAEVCIIGKRYNIVKKNATPNTINVVSAAGITVAGVASRVVGQTIVIQYDGESNWMLLL